MAGNFPVRNSVISGNAGLGINNPGAQFLSAQSNYWGHASGPLDHSNADAASLLNPTGQGSAVSEYVTWTNFLTADPFFVSAPVPQLDFDIGRNAAGEIVLSWLDGVATNLVVQEFVPGAATPAWQTLTLQTSIVGNRVQATVPAAPPTRLFRLSFTP